MTLKNLTSASLRLLKGLIRLPSLSGDEGTTADLIVEWLDKAGIPSSRHGNNIWAFNRHFDPSKPTILLNSHHDTVPPNEQYTTDPFEPLEKDGKLFGLGSNDAGGSLVSLAAVFRYFFEATKLPYNLAFAATAEEEISGKNGIESILNRLPDPEFAIVGEPTGMHLAIAETGLLVVDACARGKAGHAAHDNTLNAIYLALDDIAHIREYAFADISPVLGPVKMNVTQVNAGTKHNMVPGECHFVIDIRVNDCYTNEDVFRVLSGLTRSELRARSFRLKSSGIDPGHPFVLAGQLLGRATFGSGTLSDQALLDCPSVKIGPGDSRRSHTADEYIFLNEISEAIDLYIRALELMMKQKIA